MATQVAKVAFSWPVYPRPCMSLEHLVPRRSVKVGDAASLSAVYRSMAIRSHEANTNDGAGKKDKIF